MTNPIKAIVHAENPEPLIGQLQEAHGDVEAMPCDSYAGLTPMLETFRPDAVYSIRFAGSRDFPTDALMGPNGPKWISVGGSGVDHLGKWDPDQTIVTNSAGVAAQMMAEYAFGGFLHFSLDVPGLKADQNKRVWPSRMMRPLSGKTLLIIGLGQTGQAAAKLAKAFGMTVLGTRASPREMENVDEVHTSDDLPLLYPRADFILVCAPLLESTKGLVGEKAFNCMKDGAVLADVSRGGIVSEAALIQSLGNSRLAGAALDVFETEPLPAESALWDIPNLLISPHCSSVFEGWEQASMALFCDNLERFKRGDPLNNIVDPHKGY